jgi:hypothetical protein
MSTKKYQALRRFVWQIDIKSPTHREILDKTAKIELQGDQR